MPEPFHGRSHAGSTSPLAGGAACRIGSCSRLPIQQDQRDRYPLNTQGANTTVTRYLAGGLAWMVRLESASMAIQVLLRCHPFGGPFRLSWGRASPGLPGQRSCATLGAFCHRTPRFPLHPDRWRPREQQSTWWGGWRGADYLLTRHFSVRAEADATWNALLFHKSKAFSGSWRLGFKLLVLARHRQIPACPSPHNEQKSPSRLSL